MADELLFSALGLGTSNTESTDLSSTGFLSDHETPCTTPSSSDSNLEFYENLENPTSGLQDFYTGTMYSPEMDWSDWSNTSPSSGNYLSFSNAFMDILTPTPDKMLIN